jgi:Uma2 family endonuclease
MNAHFRQPLILTDDQYEAMHRKGAFAGLGRVELCGGVLTAISPVYLSHSRACRELIGALVVALRASGLRLEVNPEITVRFGGGFQPTADFAVWDPALAAPDLEGAVPGAAIKLVIEVADTSLADDLGQKRADYAEAGLGEYWVVELAARIVRQFWAPKAGAFTQSRENAFGANLSAVTFALSLPTDTL